MRVMGQKQADSAVPTPRAHDGAPDAWSVPRSGTWSHPGGTRSRNEEPTTRPVRRHERGAWAPPNPPVFGPSPASLSTIHRHRNAGNCFAQLLGIAPMLTPTLA